MAAESHFVPVTVVGGPLSASVSSVALAPVVYVNVEYANTGTLVHTVVDQRGTAEGWSVTLSVSAFDYVGVTPNGADIAAGAYTIQTANGPVRVSGQAISGTGGPAIPTGSATGTLDEPIMVLVANDGLGAGVHNQIYSVVLIIPAGIQAGVYTAFVNATTSAAP